MIPVFQGPLPPFLFLEFSPHLIWALPPCFLGYTISFVVEGGWQEEAQTEEISGPPCPHL